MTIAALGLDGSSAEISGLSFLRFVFLWELLAFELYLTRGCILSAYESEALHGVKSRGKGNAGRKTRLGRTETPIKIQISIVSSHVGITLPVLNGRLQRFA